MRALVVGIILLAACAAEKTEPPVELTRRQRDSAIAASRLPGARGVGSALRTADSLDARTAQIDSLSR